MRIRIDSLFSTPCAWCAGKSRDSHPLPHRNMKAFHDAVLMEILAERVASSRSRCNPRGLKRKMSNYPLRLRKRSRTRWIVIEKHIKRIKWTVLGLRSVTSKSSGYDVNLESAKHKGLHLYFNEIMDWNTSHFLHISIFLAQLFFALPWQIVPLMSQHICPALNSHAGQFCLVSIGQSLIVQHGGFVLRQDLLRFKRRSDWRSVWTGIFLQPCSMLCMVLGEIPNNCAICLCVFPKR